MTAKKHLPNGAVVDSSPIMSILDGRPSGPPFKDALSKTKPLFMSAPTYVELSLVVLGKKDPAGLKPLSDLLKAFEIQIVDFDLPMAAKAQHGCAKYGKGHHQANLNMGDLFSYGLTMQMNLPLFFQGEDFSQTDVQDAMLMLGYKFDKQHQPLPLQSGPSR